MNQEVRIIAGKYRGRKLHFPDLPGLRPTSDRIRETVFNWLMHDIRDAAVLDAFAGSGALGFEAASRGAGHVVMIEHNKQAANGLKKQAAQMGIGEVEVFCHDALSYLQETKQTFDLIFLDPPFDSQSLQPAIDMILDKQIINQGGLIYVETNAKTTFDFHTLETLKEKKAGQVQYRLLKR